MYVHKLVWLVVIGMMALPIGCAPIQPALSDAPGQQAPLIEASPTVTQPTPTVAGLQLSTTHTITRENTVTIVLPSSNPLTVQATKDLARRLALPLDQITLVSAEAVTWPDGGLGCPQPGMAYIQVQQDGMRIVLRADGKEYHYHSGERRPPFLCENPAP